MKSLLSVLGLALCLNLTTTYGALMLDVNNGTAGSGSQHIDDTTPSATVTYSFVNSSGAAADFGVLQWSASRNGAPGVPLVWSISLVGGGVVASGNNPITDFSSGFKDIFMDFRTTPGGIPNGATTTFLVTLSAPGHAAGTSYDLKYTSPGALFTVNPTGAIVVGSTPSGFSVSGSYNPVPEPVNVALGIFAGGALVVHGLRRWRGRSRSCVPGLPPS